MIEVLYFQEKHPCFKRITRFLFCILTLLSLYGYPSQAAEPIIIDQQTTFPKDYRPHLESWVSSQRNLGVETIENLRLSFVPVQNHLLNFGLVDSDIWLYFEIDNTKAEALPIYVSLGHLFLNHAQLYWRDEFDLNWQMQETGVDLLTQAHQGETRVRQPVSFEQHLPSQNKRSYFLRVRSDFPVQIQFQLLTYQDQMQQISSRQITLGIYYGLMLCFLCFGFSMMRHPLKTAFGLLSLFVCCCLLIEVSYNGILYRMLPSLTEFGGSFMASVPIITTIVLIQLSRVFSNTALLSAHYDTLLKGLMIILGLWVAVAFLWDHILAFRCFIPFLIVICVSQLGLGMLSFYQGHTPALYFTVAWTILIISLFALTTQLLGFFPVDILSNWVFELGSALTCLFLCLSLWEQAREIDKERIAACYHEQQADISREETEDILQRLSHDVRVPMEGVSGLTYLLKETNLDPMQRHYVRLISRANQSVVDAFTSVVDYAKIKSGTFELKESRFSIEELLKQAIAIYFPLLREANIELIINPSPELPKYLIGDHTRIKQLLVNLLYFSFTYTRQGEVVLNVRPVYDQKSEILYVEFQIKDTGIGIAPGHVSSLFHKATINQAITQNAKLSLAMSEQLVELMQGHLQINHELNKGSCFTVELPLKTDDASTITEPENLLPKNLTLWLAHSSTTWNQVIRSHLLSKGFNAVCLNPNKLYESIYKLSYNPSSGKCIVLIVEPRFFDLSCQQLVGDMKQNQSDALLRTVMVTRDLSSSLKPHATWDNYLLSPIFPTELLQAIEKMFLVAPKHSIESSSPPLQGCRVLITQSNESNQPVIQGMLDRLHCNYQVVDTGRQAIEAFDQQKGQFDILLIDSTLPDIDGYQVSEQIRELEIRHRFKPVTIISLTVHATSEHKDKCQAHGIDDHIGKPYTSNMLQYKLMQHFTKGFQVDEKIKETALSKS